MKVKLVLDDWYGDMLKSLAKERGVSVEELVADVVRKYVGGEIDLKRAQEERENIRREYKEVSEKLDKLYEEYEWLQRKVARFMYNEGVQVFIAGEGYADGRGYVIFNGDEVTAVSIDAGTAVTLYINLRKFAEFVKQYAELYEEHKQKIRKLRREGIVSREYIEDYDEDDDP